ncbi:MAG: hypothetical protein ACM3TR_01910 [Caulobacteraceae bacterium]
MKGKRKNKKTLKEKYPASPPCSCEICLQYCRRPGWWTVEEAVAAIDAGYADRMMLEIAPELTFGVLSPAFKGCEGGIALNIYAHQGCNFLEDNLCELHGKAFMPLECRFCHHERAGQGQQCHLDIEKDWNTSAGQELIKKWGKMIGLWERLSKYLKG